MSRGVAEPIGRALGLEPRLQAALARALERTAPLRAELAGIRAANQLKVLAAFTEAGVMDFHLHGSTGYGYGDPAREAVEAVYARAFGAEAVLVAPYLVSGTHAITSALFGVLRPGDELVYATGEPYDTLGQVIFGQGGEGSLVEFGIGCQVVPLGPAGQIDVNALRSAVGPRTKMVAFQRSRGYRWAPSRSLAELARGIAAVKAVNPEAVAFVDNCYGEFVELEEPLAVGADLMAGSLIKNPGGGLAPVGGYVAGRADVVRRAAARATAPGVAGAVGPMLDLGRSFLQGFFLAPHFVGEALAGAVVSAAFCEEVGLEALPSSGEARTDLVQAVKLGSREALIAFCEGIQSACAVNAKVRPEPSPLPGYSDEVIMAGGGFVSGATLELSVDAPIRPPFAAYLQGGLSWEQAVYGTGRGLQNLLQKGLLAR